MGLMIPCFIVCRLCRVRHREAIPQLQLSVAYNCTVLAPAIEFNLLDLFCVVCMNFVSNYCRIWRSAAHARGRAP